MLFAAYLWFDCPLWLLRVQLHLASLPCRILGGANARQVTLEMECSASRKLFPPQTVAWKRTGNATWRLFVLTCISRVEFSPLFCGPLDDLVILSTFYYITWGRGVLTFGEETLTPYTGIVKDALCDL